MARLATLPICAAPLGRLKDKSRFWPSCIDFGILDIEGKQVIIDKFTVYSQYSKEMVCKTPCRYFE